MQGTSPFIKLVPSTTFSTILSRPVWHIGLACFTWPLGLIYSNSIPCHGVAISHICTRMLSFVQHTSSVLASVRLVSHNNLSQTWSSLMPNTNWSLKISSGVIVPNSQSRTILWNAIWYCSYVSPASCWWQLNSSYHWNGTFFLGQ